MKSKYISSFFISGLAALTIASCTSDGFPSLTQVNPNESTVDLYWQDLDDCQSGLTATYNSFMSTNIMSMIEDSKRSGLSWPGASSGLGSTPTDVWLLQNYTYSESLINNKWSAIYEVIFYANQVIEGLVGVYDKYAEDFEDFEEWKLIMAQARFFRGLMHFYASETYNNGEIPIMYFVPVDTNDFFQRCSTQEVVREFYRADLQYAANVLPAKGDSNFWGSDDTGRVSQAAALAALGQSYIYEASEAKRDNDATKSYSELYTKAAECFKEIVDNSNYYLVDKCEDNFTYQNEFNSESILEINYTDVYESSYTEWDSRHLTNTLNWSVASVGGWCSIQPMYWLLRHFMHEPIDTLDPINKIELSTDYMGDIHYHAGVDVYEDLTTEQTFTLSDGTTVARAARQYPVLRKSLVTGSITTDVDNGLVGAGVPVYLNGVLMDDGSYPFTAIDDKDNTTWDLQHYDRMAYYYKTVPYVSGAVAKTDDEIDTTVPPNYTLFAIGNTTTLDEDASYVARAYRNQPFAVTASSTTRKYTFTATDGTTTNVWPKRGECWYVYYDADDTNKERPYRYRPMSQRASASIATTIDIDTPYYTYEQTPDASGFSNALSHFRKYTNWDTLVQETTGTSAGRSKINVRVIRLADIYLLYAEALVEGGANSANLDEAMMYLNRVRNRAGVVLIGSEDNAKAEFKGSASYQDTAAYIDSPDGPNDKKWYSDDSLVTYNSSYIITVSEFMDQLMLERVLELCIEGHCTRFIDLRRWHSNVKDHFTTLNQYIFSTDKWVRFITRDDSDDQCDIGGGWSWCKDDTTSTIKAQTSYSATNYVQASNDYFPIPSYESQKNPYVLLDPWTELPEDPNAEFYYE
ncbi:MAG: RagB/SusD family nutrient uptake outer membrane protein [Rikenellaceae bacterium]